MIDYSYHPLHPLTELEAFSGIILGKNGGQSRLQREKSRKLKDKIEENNRYIVDRILNKTALGGTSAALEHSIACLAVSLENSGKKEKERFVAKFQVCRRIGLLGRGCAFRKNFQALGTDVGQYGYNGEIIDTPERRKYLMGGNGPGICVI